MLARFIVRFVCGFILFVIVFGIVTGHIASDRRLVLRTLKKYVNLSEKDMNEQITASADALRERVDREYILTNRDGFELHGYLVRSAAESGNFVFCSHSYRSRMAGFEFGETADIWLSRGYNVFLVDHRAHGKSGGCLISFGQHESDDCIEWINFMREEFGEDIRIALLGQSMGATTVLMMSGKENLPDNVRCVISDSGYTDFYTELWGLLPLPKWLRGPVLWPMDRYLGIVNGINMKKSDALDAVKQARVPILFLHGEKDKFVSLRMNEELFDACSGEKERVVFPDATHIKCHAYYPEQYEQAVTGFAEKYL